MANFGIVTLGDNQTYAGRIRLEQNDARRLEPRSGNDDSLASVKAKCLKFADGTELCTAPVATPGTALGTTVVLTANQTTNVSPLAELAWDAEIVSSNGDWWTAALPKRLVVPSAFDGYLVLGAVSFFTSSYVAGEPMQAVVTHYNSAGAVQSYPIHMSTIARVSAARCMSGSFVRRVTAGDYFTLHGFAQFATDATALGSATASAARTRFSIRAVGA